MSLTAKAALLVAVALVAAHITNPDRDSAAAGDVDDAASLNIPPSYLAEYREAGRICAEVDWALLAAVGKIETDHGRSPLPGVHSGANSAGASGPMQFMPATWSTMQQRHPAIGPDRYNPAHAIPAAGHLLCDETDRLDSVTDAVYAYNHSAAYVSTVLSQAADYRHS